ncbi:hypothetical protein M434DRAFT_397263 [Hypoxylon sp. CO27-5]|nr:hypothetical protein M434DRAFT_397263 [Hypoxylon sp. CO27-5]
MAKNSRTPSWRSCCRQPSPFPITIPIALGLGYPLFIMASRAGSARRRTEGRNEIRWVEFQQMTEILAFPEFLQCTT